MNEIEVSVVMPCLNEATTVGICVEKALRTMEKLEIKGEVVVSDNGSTDGSVEIAERAGAKVVHQTEKGYGNAYLKGFREAEGKFIVMGDADDSYDFTDIERFVQPLRDGYDMVMGTRIKGEIKKGAMPALHRYFGVPVLTGMLNLLYRSGISDAHCGMRSFTREAYQRMHLQTTGMEFASEMIIKAKQLGLKIVEIPITLHPDGRSGKPHLKSFPDGWRHIRFMLNYKPDFLYFLPGWFMLICGMVGLIAAIIAGFAVSDIMLYPFYWSVAGALLAFCGYFLLILGVISKAKNYTGHFPQSERFINGFYRKFTSGGGIWKGLIAMVIGVVCCTWGWWGPSLAGFTILGILIAAMGIVTVFASFLLGQMNIFGKE